VLGYLYVAFAVYTDADLDEAEKKEIFVALSEWLPDESRSNIYADGCQAVVNDLARIGQADGHYDETEKKWASALAEQLGVNAV
jgi:5-formyltetrahydrofolate cyclo-ligase